MATESSRSMLRKADGSRPPSPLHNIPEHSTSPPSPALFGRSDLSVVVTKAEAGTAPPNSAPRGWHSWSGQREPEPPGSRVVSGILRRDRREEAVRLAAVGARLAATALCLVSFSVLAADRDKGWALDSYNRYKQFRYRSAQDFSFDRRALVKAYCVSVNVIGFVYSGFQVYAQAHYMMTENHIIRRPMGDYLDFAMDQILAYLLISSSSSATARTGDWVSNWGRDPFPNMATGSVAVSFLAFLAFALSALISAYNLFRPSL
ncbi:hypothetical protein BHE74_00033969 [Ensete ventricosum]|nr:hypothetical protein BHE74_00033969 [Ensete ventricosum]